MKISYDHQIFCDQTYGGISKSFFELANHIALIEPKKITVKIISPFYRNKYIDIKNKNFLFKGLKIPDFKKSGRICSIMNSIISPALLNNYDPDIIHLTNYNSLINFKSRAKKIVTIHDMIHELFPQHFTKIDKTSDFKRYVVDNSDHIICNSKNTQNDLVKLFKVDINKTSVVYFGCPLINENVKNIVKIKKPYLLYVGKRDGYKNFQRFLEAYASPEIKNYFDIVAFGGGSFSKEEKKMFDKLNISKSSLKQVNGDDSLLTSFYKNASLFVYPSIYEGFGFPPLEAMKHGCPVVCSYGSSISEIVDDAALLFDPYSINSIKDKIISVIYNDYIRSSLISKGFNQVNKYSWARCARETYEIYEKVLS